MVAYKFNIPRLTTTSKPVIHLKHSCYSTFTVTDYFLRCEVFDVIYEIKLNKQFEIMIMLTTIYVFLLIIKMYTSIFKPYGNISNMKFY